MKTVTTLCSWDTGHKPKEIQSQDFRNIGVWFFQMAFGTGEFN